MITWFKIFVINKFYYLVGLAVLLIVKIKYYFIGFPKSSLSNITEYEKSFDYNIRIANQWISHLNDYTNDNHYLVNKSVLELGPGSNLGVGFYLLYKGALKYNSFDIYKLADNVPINFYKLFFKRLLKIDGVKSVDYLENELKKLYDDGSSDINYVVKHDSNLASSFDSSSIDITFSQAAFEHFVNVEDVIKQLSIVCKSNAVIIAEIDLQTHSRWIREKDPNNVYRYSPFIYNLLSTKTSPNRIRPCTYNELFNNCGWYDIKILPLSIIDERKRVPVKYLNQNYRNDKNKMDYLSILLLAKKK